MFTVIYVARITEKTVKEKRAILTFVILEDRILELFDEKGAAFEFSELI